MSEPGAFQSAVAHAVLGVEAGHADLLAATVRLARATFRARAASVFLVDPTDGALVFAAVAGEGERDLLGRRFPRGTGVAGWVAASGQPLVLDHVSQDPRFSREAAESTGYVPDAIMAVPLTRAETVLGTLQVLDRASGPFTLKDMDLLGLFASQAAVALDLTLRARRAEALLAGQPDELVGLVKLAAALDRDPERRVAGLRLVDALGDLLG